MAQYSFTGTFQDLQDYLEKHHVEPQAHVSFVSENTQNDIKEDHILHPSNHEWLNSEIQKGIDSLDSGKGKVMNSEDFENRRKQLRSEYLARRK